MSINGRKGERREKAVRREANTTSLKTECYIRYCIFLLFFLRLNYSNDTWNPLYHYAKVIFFRFFLAACKNTNSCRFFASHFFFFFSIRTLENRMPLACREHNLPVQTACRPGNSRIESRATLSHHGVWNDEIVVKS